MAKNALTTITAEPGGREIVVSRIFDAPGEQTFKASTDPNLMPQWWGVSSLGML
ncbi:MAG: hypothetical protein WCE82_10275 [Halobacteriota archaeon]